MEWLQQMTNLCKKMWEFKDRGKSFDAAYRKVNPKGDWRLHESFRAIYRMHGNANSCRKDATWEIIRLDKKKAIKCYKNLEYRSGYRLAASALYSWPSKLCLL